MNNFWLYVITLFVCLVYRSVHELYPSELIKAAPFALTALGIAQLGFFQKGRLYVGYIRNWAFFAVYAIFLLLLLISYVRSYDSNFSELGTYTLPLQFLLLIFYTYLFFHRVLATEGSIVNLTRQCIMLLLIPAVAFVFIDLILYLNGVHVEAKAVGEEVVPSVIAKMLGLDLQRAHFVLGGNHNNYALLMGGALLLSLLLLVSYSQHFKYKVFYYFTIAVVGFGLLIADVRGVFLGLTFALGCWFAVSQLRWKTPSYLFIFVPLILLLTYPFLQEIIKSLGSSFVAELSRQGDASDVFTFNNRTHIWAGCLEFLADFKLQHLAGYGQAGHMTSEAYLEWAWLFPRAVTHNLYLQYILDTGYIGFVSLLAILCMIVREGILLLRAGIKAGLIPLAYVVYFVISGIFEPSIGIYNHPNTTFFLLVLFFIGLIRNYHIKQLEKSKSYSAVQHSTENRLTLV